MWVYESLSCKRFYSFSSSVSFHEAFDFKQTSIASWGPYINSGGVCGGEVWVGGAGAVQGRGGGGGGGAGAGAGPAEVVEVRARAHTHTHTDEDNTLSRTCDRYSTAHLRAARPCAASPAGHGMASAAWSRGEGPLGEGVTRRGSRGEEVT